MINIQGKALMIKPVAVPVEATPILMKGKRIGAAKINMSKTSTKTIRAEKT